MKSGLLRILCLILGLLAFSAVGADAARHRDTITIHGFGDSWAPYFQQAAADWDAALDYRGIDVLYVAHPYASCQSMTPAASGVSVCEWEPLKSSPLPTGEAYGDASGSYLKGTVRVYIIADTLPSWQAAQHLVCHEIGHTFGLYHKDAPDPSCMAPCGYCEGLTAPSVEDAALAVPNLGWKNTNRVKAQSHHKHGRRHRNGHRPWH